MREHILRPKMANECSTTTCLLRVGCAVCIQCDRKFSTAHLQLDN